MLRKEKLAPHKHVPFPLFVGRIVRTEEVQLVLAEDAKVNVAARAQVVVNTSCNSISHKLFGFFLLRKKNPSKHKSLIPDLRVNSCAVLVRRQFPYVVICGWESKQEMELAWKTYRCN